MTSIQGSHLEMYEIKTLDFAQIFNVLYIPQPQPESNYQCF